MSQTASAILFIGGLSLAMFLTMAIYHSAYSQKADGRSRVGEMTADAMILAILLIMSFVPNMGFIAITPLISLTLLHLPVLLAAALGGWRKGLLMGFVFGVCSYINAIGQPAGFNAFFALPWTAIPPRMIFGLLAGIAFSLIRKLNKGRVKSLYFALAGFLLTCLHTVLVFADLYLFFHQEIGAMLSSSDPIAQGTTITALALFAIGILGEATLAAVLIPPLTQAVSKATPNLYAHRGIES